MTPPFLTLFCWQVVRNLSRHRLLALLNILSIALGVAVCLAIQVANSSANSSFAAGIDLVAGKAQLEIRGDVDETLWPKISSHPGVQSTTAVLEGVVTLPDYPGEYLQLLGVDLFTNEPFRTFELQHAGQRMELEKWLATPGAIALSREFAAKYAIEPGAQLRVLVNSTLKSVVVLGFIDPGDSPVAVQSRFGVMDLGWAQELFTRQGRLTSVQVLLKEPQQSSKVIEGLRQWLPADLSVQAPRQRSLQIQQMLSAFQLNLTALSMVSLLVGTFLIYTTVSATVARRRVEIGILRSLGATRWQVRFLFLGEACLLGSIGIGLGVLCGVALAGLLVGAVAKTISSLYLLVSIERSHLGAVDLITASLLGFGAVLAGAWIPASDAARIDPLMALNRSAPVVFSASHSSRFHRLGIVLLGIALLSGWAALRFGPALLGFVSAFCVLAAFALFAPRGTLFVSRVASRLSLRWTVGRLAAENLGKAVHRNGITVGALSVAVAMMVGLTIMIFSFRQSVDEWVNFGVVADLYVAPASNETIGIGASVPAEAVEWLASRPEVKGVDTFFEKPVAVGGERALLAVIAGQYRDNMHFVGGGSKSKMAAVFAGQGVAVTESFARKFHVAEGSRINLATADGNVQFPVMGVYSDYTRDQGVILISRSLFALHWKDSSVQSLAVYLQPDAKGELLAEQFRTRFSARGEFTIYSNRALRLRILSIFDQTFTVTYVLRSIAVLVALVGIFLTVSTLVIERTREIGALRAVGASRAQVHTLFMVESALIGFLASVLGLSAGLLLAIVLTCVINPAFFGWSITLRLPWQTLLSAPLWIVAAAVAASYYPAWRGSRTPIAQAVREE